MTSGTQKMALEPMDGGSGMLRKMCTFPQHTEKCNFIPLSPKTLAKYSLYLKLVDILGFTQGKYKLQKLSAIISFEPVLMSGQRSSNVLQMFLFLGLTAPPK